ncbi:YceD family protein [Austwickia chelonae]|uniref:Metal-binding protein n=1 Tax=Austwickia chelonae NBRC 105200 TaxID=1184607 RepID=K6W461_9MICO|nr:DUF177 domain-containing protein [Austwickia chelonae]GAB76587.1 hypothetical protein AUCHE_01_01490 [Austwickia chelonae NBRC 105200]
MNSVDPRSPLVFDTRVLGRRAGSMSEFQRIVRLDSEMGTDVIAIPAGEELEIDARLESVLEGVLVSGTVESVARGACVRCLETMSLPVQARFQELFAYADRATHHHEVGDDDEDQYVLEKDLLDLQPVLRDAVVLQLPFQPVCRTDCPGLCSECGQSLADDLEHSHEIIDPRWASLTGLLTDGVHVEEKRN